MIVFNRIRGTWQKDVNAFVVLSEHERLKFVAAQFAVERMFVKPNFVEDPGPGASPPSSSETLVYLGRLSSEKGPSTLLEAWAAAGLCQFGRLMFVGDGPDRAAMERQASSLGLSSASVTFVGWKAPAEALTLLASARVLVAPSRWYEGCPMALIEAASLGRPAIVSDMGGMREIVAHGKNGLAVPAGDASAWGQAMKTILTDGSLADLLGRTARRYYLERFTPERTYARLMEIYAFAMDRGQTTRSY